MTRFDLDMDGSMEPSEHGRWVRYEDAREISQGSAGYAWAARETEKRLKEKNT